MAHDKDKSTEPKHPDRDEGQLRSLISLFNWLVGEVVTARVMILRLAGDLVRIGALPVDEINGMPLTPEIIDSVMSNFPSDPMWQPMGQRLRRSLEALRDLDLREAEADGEEDDELELGDDDVFEEEEDADEEPRDSSQVEMQAQVIYRHPDHELTAADSTILSRVSRTPGRNHN